MVVEVPPRLGPAPLAGAVLLAFMAVAPAGAAAVPPGSGVTFAQVDYDVDEIILPYSSVGRITVDVAALRAATGIVTGFVNVTTPLGWVVQNLPVFAEYPAAAIGTDFMLAVVPGSRVTSLAARVEYTPAPLFATAAGALLPFPVGSTLVAEGGKGDQGAAATAAIPVPYPVPPPPGVVVFGDGDTFVCCQQDHSNVEAAKAQCGPAALANSVDWLAHRHPLFFRGLPEHRPGLGADGTLVGEIETRMSRPFTSRRRGRGVNDLPFVTGKLRFLEDYGLNWLLRVTHQDDVFGNDDVEGPAGRAVSRGVGKPPTAEYIIDEICAGEDVEIGWSQPGGHWEVGICAGELAGLPFVALLSDRNQNDDGKGTGPESARWSLLWDLDKDGVLNLVNKANTPEVDIVVTESPIPEIDELLWFDAWLTVHTGLVTEPIHFTGTGILVADTLAVADRDGNGREEIPVHLADLDLAGTSNSFGPCSLHLGAPAVGALSTLASRLEEQVNATPGVLDVPPFTPSGQAALWLSVPAAVTLGGATWYSQPSLVMSGLVSFKPAAPGEQLVLAAAVWLVDAAMRPMGDITAATFTPRPQLDVRLDLTVERTRLCRSDALVASLAIDSHLPPFAGDLLVAIEQPDGRTRYVTNLAPFGGFMTSGGGARQFLPLRANTSYPAGFSSFEPGFLSFRFCGAEPPGDYRLRATLIVPGSLQDGRLDPPDVIASTEVPFTYTGAGLLRRSLRPTR